MARYLVVVESPTKVKSLKKYLGKEFNVLASKGHVKDLPSKKLGVDVDNDFTPEYVTIPGKEEVLRSISDAARDADTVYLAPDPDREGEAIAWHIASELKNPKSSIRRVLIQEITKKGVQDALAKPLDLNLHKYESQQARRILDRLVGYQISPILWRKVKRGLSAGRVQSVALRLICEREKEIKDFKSVEYWTIDVLLKAGEPPEFFARVFEVDGEKAKVDNETQATSICQRIEKSELKVHSIQNRERKRNPVAPFTTSKLQQEAYRKLGFNVRRTMSVAQSLYEGIDLGDGPVGLITYMRTDSTRVSDEAITFVREFIAKKYGTASMPESPVVYKSKKSAQDAHEAIRPTSKDFSPDKVEKFLNREQFELYRLIWNRFVASQMKPAIYDQLTCEILADAGKIKLRSTGSRLLFKGFLEVYEEGRDEEKKADEEQNDTEVDNSTDRILPKLVQNEVLKLSKLNPEQHFTQPPPRFNESSMVKTMDDLGIGRPSTYATILSTIVDREYVTKQDNRYSPSPLGDKVTELLIQAFPDVMNTQFTAQMENDLDKIEEGATDWVKLLSTFYKPFSSLVKSADKTLKNVKAESIPTGIKCDKCDVGEFVIKWSTRGEFLGCSNYPTCRNTREFEKSPAGEIIIKALKKSGDKCPTCSKDMLIKNGPYGEFIACEDYPVCNTIKSAPADAKCPKCESGGLIARKSRYGKLFWGCNTYPKCNFAVWDKPIEKPCGQCKFPIVVEKNTKRYGLRYSCPDCRALFNDQFEFLMIVPPRPSRFKKAESTTEAKAPAKEKKTSAKKASKKPSKSKKKVVLEES